ncbi:conserved hypothetical protein, secreted [Candidatus Magnetomorum sp. HK-1]|nr:conserved hypothetical protein, secreted [Candidatus Magnetomorum sp. HK-1]
MNKLKPAIITLLSILFLMTACTQVPYPVTYPFAKQEKMQAAQHWDVLATDIAEQIKLSRDRNKEVRHIPVFIQPMDQTPFGKIFHNLITSRLVQKGVPVSPYENDALHLTYNARVLQHSKREIKNPPLLYSAVGLGITVTRHVDSDDLWDLAFPVGIIADGIRSATSGKTPNEEVIISLALKHNDTFIIHRSDIYYINKSDGWHYDTDAFQKATKGKKFQVVGQ